METSESQKQIKEEKKLLYQTIEELIEKASEFKAKGNDYFKEKNYIKALGQYHRVFTFLNGLVDEKNELYKYAKNEQKIKGEWKNQINDLKQTTFLNMTQIYLNQGKYEKGRQTAQKSLNLKQTAKGFFRLGMCNMNLNNLDEARQDLIKAADLDDQIKNDVTLLLVKINQLERDFDKQMAKKMQKLFI